MLPSLLAEDLRSGLKDFLTTGFEASDPFFAGVVKRFAEQEELWWKGPWVQVGLPFRPGRRGKKFFWDFEMRFGGYEHQEAAWGRICSDLGASNTLVATGTGSGKSECFLYPVLDHCARMRDVEMPGVKALVIYPMNALATDQAQRFAQLCHEIPRFRKVRVGLFVGGLEPGTGAKAMTSSEVITDRDTLRQHPPDVLLTNYKMLDYLLIRPEDQRLWKENTAETLRYVVVDELHTFDGAQGTDLAMLLRRLRARLGTALDQLICVGTSATLGDASSTQPLRDYATQIFGGAFPQASVITESRLSITEFFREVPEYVFEGHPDLEQVLDPLRFATTEEALARWFGLFFPDQPPPEAVAAPQWRITLGELLKRHLLIQNLFRFLEQKHSLARLEDLAEAVKPQLTSGTRPYAPALLNALLALVSWARVGPLEAPQPWVTVREQVWMRELRRMVARVSVAPEEVHLTPEMELQGNARLHLPLMQCSECHTSGWLTRRAHAQDLVMRDLDQIYAAWFSRNPECLRLYPRDGVPRPIGQAHAERFCTDCGTLNPADSRGPCTACRSANLLEVWGVSEVQEHQHENLQINKHRHRCPSCGTQNRLILLGARTTTLGAQVVEQSWQTPFNDDKKLIAFSDSVQDAAHRAGFFGARTYSANIRRAVFQQSRHLSFSEPTLQQFLTSLQDAFKDPKSPLHMSEERFVAEFIGPNMEWQQEWRELQEHGRLRRPSRLVERVGKRLEWQAFAELTYLSRRGRSLERQGLLLAAVAPERVQAVARVLQEPLREQLGVDLDSEGLFQWLWGFLEHLRQRGAVLHPEMQGYARTGNLFTLTRPNDYWIPGMGLRSFHPVLLSLGQHRYQDTLRTQQGDTWYQQWMQRFLVLSDPRQVEEAYRLAIRSLEEERLLSRVSSDNGDTVLLRPEALQLWTDPVQLISEQGQYWLNIPEALQGALLQMPCLDGEEVYTQVRDAPDTLEQRLERSELGRIFAAEHTGLLERRPREALEGRFKSGERMPWYENLLSATPTLEMGVDIGSLSSVLLCSVPPGQANFLQRIGRAGRRDGNAFALTLADGGSPHDLYFFAEPEEMMAGAVQPPGVFLEAAEVLRRQLFAFCLDHWVQQELPENAFPERTKGALDALLHDVKSRFPLHFESFVRQQGEELLFGFLQLLRPNLTPAVEQRMKEYLFPQGEQDGMLIRLFSTLQGLNQEREQYRRKAQELKSQLEQLRQRPEDEATSTLIEEVKRERSSVQGMMVELENRHLLNTLTDAGLIPNYAFPESGVELKSVIWRRRQDQEGAVDAPTYKYERPAAAALAEFAPRNRFYANHRQVEIDQVEVQSTQIETWRFCPECSHSQRIDALHPDRHATCPRCKAELWQDSAQKLELLRLKRVIATTEDRKSRIDDSNEDREPKFYVRQTLVDFAPDQVRLAWKLDREDLPFGFEYVEQAEFCDVNFGERTHAEQTIRIAGQDDLRPGFKLCKGCGKIQNRFEDPEDHPRAHAIDCKLASRPEDPWVRLHLYREYQSELLRILVPYTRSGVNEQVVHSFIAALQLGFKLQFGGKVDHLRFSQQDQPNPQDSTGSRRHYILIFDSVPGGTGYLKQLLAQQAGTMLELLRKARAHLQQCECRHDPERDGCYRCIFQYRMSRKMSSISRQQALDILQELLEESHELVQVQTLSDIQIHPLLGSPLEQGFLDALRALSRKPGLPHIKQEKVIVQGGVGYRLQVGDSRYLVEPQKLLGREEGVRVSCQPDFLISSTGANGIRPIAVFCDGWQFHQNSISEDALKRSALVASGKFRVWSITYQDVKGALDEKFQVAEQSPPLASPLHTYRRESSPANHFVEAAFWENSSLIALVHWLWKAGPNEQGALVQVQRNAAHTLAQMIVSPQSPEADALQAEFAGLQSRLRPGQPAPGAALCALSPESVNPRIFAWWPAAYQQKRFDGENSGAVCLDETEASESLHLRWRLWLWLFNHLQFLPGILLTTEAGMQSQAYASLHPAPPSSSASPSSAEWKEVLEHCLEEMRDALTELEQRGIPAPDSLGEDLADEQGKVVAETELRWTDAQVCVLTEDQSEYQPLLTQRGWATVVASPGWPERVLPLLGVNS
jgi:DEAD/DEAH box helicase domain-containing protein